MSIKTGKRMLYNFIRWCCFLLAVVVEGDESSWPRIANWWAVLAVALIDSPASL